VCVWYVSSHDSMTNVTRHTHTWWVLRDGLRSSHAAKWLKPQSNGPSYSSTVIGTLVVDGWAVTFGIAMRGLGRAAAPPSPFLAERNVTAHSSHPCEVQAVRAHAPLPYWSGAAIFDRAGSACRQYCSSSSALGVICWSRRAFNSPLNHRWPCVRCCQSTSVHGTAEPTIWHSNIYTIIRHF